jgi:methyl-accepting chemotaxis protein
MEPPKTMSTQQGQLGLISRFNSRIGMRLGMGFALMSALMVALSLAGAWQLRQQDAQFAAVLDTTVPHLMRLQSVGTEVDVVNLAARDAILATDEAVSNAALARIEKGRTNIGQQIEKLQAELQQGDTETQRLGNDLGTHSSGILVTLVKFSRLHKAHRTEQARALFDRELLGKMQALSDTIKQAQDLRLKGLIDQKDRARARMWSAMVAGGLILITALGLSGVLAWRLTRSVTQPIGQAVDLARKVAQGDLSTRMTVARHDEIGLLLSAMISMQDRLGELVRGIRDTVHQIERTSAEIITGNEDLSARTDRASQSLHATTVAMDELASTFQHSTESAKSAHGLVGLTSQGVTRSGEVVSQVVSNMQEISHSSARIGDIIGVIDGIAFQTNILALNAAVEAARAGEQGRGFAVVASEVRALAQRSATAAREIKSLIQASVEKVELGSGLVSEAGQTMGDLIRQVEQVSALISSISSISDQQTLGVSQVNHSVTELDEATQRNAALVQQTSSAAAALRAETQRLSAAIGIFRLH